MITGVSGLWGKDLYLSQSGRQTWFLALYLHRNGPGSSFSWA